MSNLNQRFSADLRQFGGMLMICGFCAIIQPIANIVNSFDSNGALNDDPTEIPFWIMIGAFCLFLNGFSSVVVGFAACVMDSSHVQLSTFLICINQLAWIPYITDMVNVGKMANNDPSMQGLIPPGHNPTETDVMFVASMGVVAIACYGCAYVGSLSFMAFGLHSLNTRRYHPAGYFKGRMTFYSLLLAIGGGVQFALGSYSAVEFRTGSAGPLVEGRIRAAMLVVNYPVVSVAVGAIQVFHGLWGMARSFGFHAGVGDNMYQFSMAVQWIVVLCFQDLMQISYLDLNVMTPMAAGIAAVSFGLHMLPAYLDYKMRTLPEAYPQDYYIAVPVKEIYSHTFDEEDAHEHESVSHIRQSTTT